MILSLLLFALSVVFYALKESAAHGKLKWSGDPYGFWGSESYERKYKRNYMFEDTYKKYDAPKNWYYKLSGVKYREKFPLSSTLLVMFTDGVHLSQTAFKLLLCASIVLYKPWLVWWKDALIYWLVFSLVFAVFYRIFSK